jgi:hypothetical protein
MKKLKAFTGTTKEEVEEKAVAWLGSRQGKIVYSAPTLGPRLPFRKLQGKWEVEVEYDEEEESLDPLLS